jgi:hypothetical protein
VTAVPDVLGVPPPPQAEPHARGSSESFRLLRSALIVGLILGVPTYLALISRNPPEPWRPDARLEIHGDSWDGNLVTDGDRVYLMSREEINGFWGVLYVRSSADGGRTWGDPVQVSAAGGPSAARHTLTVGPDGSLWAAWSQMGSAPSTQQLILRRSRDDGRTWEAPVRASPPIVGLVGIPVLVMTPEISFVAYTDGDRGTVIVQELDADGASTTDAEALRSTTRELYSDSPFLDAGLAAAAVDGRMVVIANDGDGLWRSDAGNGQAWIQRNWYSGPAFAPARLAVVDGRMTALAVVPTPDGKTRFTTETSTDGGWTWATGATWFDANGGEASMAVTSDRTEVLWESCAQMCLSSVLRMRDAAVPDSQALRVSDAAGRPAGVLLTDDSMVVAWIEQGGDGAAEDRTLVVATGPRP